MTKLTAKDILIQAALTIESSYWIKGDEHKGADDEESVEELERIGAKYIKLPPLPEQWLKAVTGVCSVGAISLAVATKKKTVLTEYDDLSARDFATRKAGEALALVIRDQNKWDGVDPLEGGSLNVIAEWNDAHERTRAQVVKAFNKALLSPLLNARTLWTLSFDTYWGRDELVAYVFPTKGEAEEFIAVVKRRKDILEEGKQSKSANPKADAIVDKVSWHNIDNLEATKIEGLT